MKRVTSDNRTSRQLYVNGIGAATGGGGQASWSRRRRRWQEALVQVPIPSSWPVLAFSSRADAPGASSVAGGVSYSAFARRRFVNVNARASKHEQFEYHVVSMRSREEAVAMAVEAHLRRRGRTDPDAWIRDVEIDDLGPVGRGEDGMMDLAGRRHRRPDGVLGVSNLLQPKCLRLPGLRLGELADDFAISLEIWVFLVLVVSK